MRAPTGDQHTIEHEAGGRHFRATVTELAATLRELTIDGEHLVEPFAEDARPAKGQGIVLAPWPGRTAGATWQLDGAPQRLAITEVATGNAIHGLLRYTPYTLVDRTPSSVRLAATIYPQLGFPFVIETTVEYALGDDGLTVTHTATNVGDGRAPWACGAHPYLAVGRTAAEQLTLRVPASSVLTTDDRMIPTGTRPVADRDGTDLRRGRLLGELDLDAGFTDVQHEGGRAVSTLTDPAGRGTAIWQDEAFGCIVVFTPRDFPAVDGVRQVAAVEPMSAPANALNSGEGLAWLEPGASWRGTWGIAPVGR